jgi:hypothetical protein
MITNDFQRKMRATWNQETENRAAVVRLRIKELVDLIGWERCQPTLAQFIYLDPTVQIRQNSRWLDKIKSRNGKKIIAQLEMLSFQRRLF